MAANFFSLCVAARIVGAMPLGIAPREAQQNRAKSLSWRDVVGEILAALVILVRPGLANVVEADKNVRAPIVFLHRQRKP